MPQATGINLEQWIVRSFLVLAAFIFLLLLLAL